MVRAKRRAGYRQPAGLDNKFDGARYAGALFDIGQDKGPMAAHFAGVAAHHAMLGDPYRQGSRQRMKPADLDGFGAGLFQRLHVGDDVGSLLDGFQAGEPRFGSFEELLGIGDKTDQVVFAPGKTGIP
jgi:hypothetical protein